MERPAFPTSGLKHLEVIGYNFYDVDKKATIPHMIDRCGVSLKVLGLYHTYISTVELCSILRQSVELTQLRLSSCRGLRLDDIFNFLTVPLNASETTCPSLQELHLDDMSYTKNRSVQPFVDMAVSRWRYARIGVSNFSLFESVDDLKSSLSQGQSQELKLCISEGLNYAL